MNQNIEFLEYIYQNAEMGVETIRQIIEIAEQADFSEHLQAQLKEYQSIYDEAKQRLNECGHPEKDIGTMQKITVYMAIGMKTLTDKTPSHIAEMLIQGSTMGIIDAQKNIKKYFEAEDATEKLAIRLLKMEERNIEQLKKFL